MNNEQLTPRITPTLITSYPDQLAHILNRFIEDFYEGDWESKSKGNLDSIEQTTTSYDDGGVNIITAYLSDGTTSEFQIRNGKKGSQGDPGTPGADGQDATIAVGTTTTLPAGSSATVTDSGTPSAAVFNFGIPKGADGTDGTDGADGFSPIANVTKSGDTATITITDENGTTTASVTDGTDGAAATITAGTTTTLSPGSSATVTNSGTSSAAVFDFGIPQGATGSPGADGADGADGFSPIATVTKSGDTATISITDENGTTTATVTDGAQGSPGPANSLSIGTVTSGTTASATITGTPPNQTLSLVLPKGDPGQDANVVNAYSTSTTDAYSASYVNSAIPTVNNATLTIQKNGTSVGTFTANASTNTTANITVPTNVSELNNDSGFITSIPTASASTLGGIKVGTNLSIDANGVLSASCGALPNNLAYIGSEVAGGGALIQTADIADGAVTTDKIADGAVTPAKLGDTGWINASSQAGIEKCYYRRIGNIVYVILSSAGNKTIGASYTTIFTLPVGFRPSMAWNFVWQNLSSADARQNGWINPSGTIELYSNVSKSYWYGSTSFPVD